MGCAYSLVSPQGTHMTDLLSPAIVAPAAAGAGGIALAALIPGVDINAVIGAFAGALFLVVFSKDLSVMARLGYLVSSWIFGYFAATELTARVSMQSTGLAAFVGGLLCVAISISLLEWVQAGKAPAWLGLLRRGDKS